MKTTSLGILSFLLSQASFAAGVLCSTPSNVQISLTPKSKTSLVYAVKNYHTPERVLPVRAQEVVASKKVSLVEISSDDQSVKGMIISKEKKIKVLNHEVSIQEISARIRDTKMMKKYPELDGETSLNCKAI